LAIVAKLGWLPIRLGAGSVHFVEQGASRAGDDPIRPVSFLVSSHSAQSSFCVLECYKAAAGSLTLSAMS
jgi:hypothetical protein